MRMDKPEEFIEAYVKGEITEEEFEGWGQLTYPRQLELKLGRLQYENAELRAELERHGMPEAWE